ncbi:MAG: DMT family transporter [Pseudonocardiaceae bacterium]
MSAGGGRSAATATRGARSVGTALTVGLGMAMAVQARINGELGRQIGDGFVAALLSFLGGLVLLVLLAVTWPGMRRGLGRVRAALRDQRSPHHHRQPYQLRPYHLLGGICGALLVTSQGVTVATVGVAVFTVAVVAGQAVSSLLVDRAGVGPGGPQAITVARVIGAALALAAVVLAVSDRLGAPADLWPALLPALAGVGIAWQQAVNGRVGVAARRGGSPLAGMLPAALVNFVAGTLALLLAVAVEVVIRGLPDPLPAQPWLYLGGPLGVLFIGTATAIVPVTGVLLLGLGTVAGQLVGALLLDLFLPAGGGHLTTTALAGTALTLVAITVIALPGRRREADPV